MSRESHQRVINRRTALKGIGAGSVGLVGLGGRVVAKPGKGGGKKECDLVVPDDYSTIQGAVDAADSGDTVCVKTGTYREQVVINKDLTLKNAEGASPTIEAPDTLDGFTIPESKGNAWHPVVLAYGGSESNGDISGSETVNVNVTGFTVNGRGTQPTNTKGKRDRKAGIFYRNVGQKAKIMDNTVEKMGVGGAETMGILAYGDSDVIVKDNDVSEFERGGIGANGDGGKHPSPTMRIRNNTLDSNSDIDGWAPNGIQIGFGASGDVKNNTIKNCLYAAGRGDYFWTASGVLIFESDNVAVQGNTVENNDVALAASSGGWFLKSADNHKFIKNEITNAILGVHLRATAFDGLTKQDPSVSNNKVTNNTIKDPNENDSTTNNPVGDTGVLLEGRDWDSDDDDGEPDYDPVVKNNKIIRNTITGFPEQVSDEGTDTKVHAIEP